MPRKHVLAWADVRNGYQHDSISHAVATIERLGRQLGAYDTFIRTDSQLITKRPITFPAGTGIATGDEDRSVFAFAGFKSYSGTFSTQHRVDLLSALGGVRG